MFIKNLEINNFRCFGKDFELPEFHVPNGSRGSGLNIFVGENGTGKTSVLDVLDLIVRNPFSSRRRISISDFRDDDTEQRIEVKAYTNEKFKVRRLWGNTEFESRGFLFYATIRLRDESRRLLDNIVVDNEFIPTKESESQIKAVEKRQTASGPYGQDRISNFDIYYLDKSRDRHISSSGYGSLLSSVWDDMNFHYLRALQKKDGDSLKKIAKYINKNTKQVYEFTGKDKVLSQTFEKIERYLSLKDVRLDFLTLLEPYLSAIMAQRKKDSLRQIQISKLGSGIEMFCSLLFLDTIYDSSDGSVVYCIDEPELHLHPQFQRKLFDFLKEASTNKQIFISTHSPYFIETELIDKIFRFQRENEGEMKIDLANPSIKIKQNRVFFFHHLPLFFTNKAIFVEGATDYDLITRCCINKGHKDLISHLFFLGGSGDGKFFEKFCANYYIDAFFIYDIDYIEDDLKHFFDDSITIESKGKDKKQWYRDHFSRYETKYKEKKEELKQKNIFIWSKPDIVDVLDSVGTPKDGMENEVEECINFISDEEEDPSEI